MRIIYFPANRRIIKRTVESQAAELRINESELAELESAINFIQSRKGYFPPENYHWLYQMLEMRWPVEDILLHLT